MVSWITDLEGKKLRMKIEKVKKNQVSKCWMCSIEGLRLLLSNFTIFGHQNPASWSIRNWIQIHIDLKFWIRIPRWNQCRSTTLVFLLNSNVTPCWVANCAVEKYIVLNLGIGILNSAYAFVLHFEQKKNTGCGPPNKILQRHIKFGNT